MFAMYEFGANAFDTLSSYWEHPRTHRVVTGGLVFIFLFGLAGIELNRQGLIPQPWSAMTPLNHFHAVNLAFGLVLIMEVASLIFVLPLSVSKSVGKQFEILSLILLRDSFKELVNFPEPVQLAGNLEPFWHIVSNALGAFVIFVILGLYYRQQKHRAELMSPSDRLRFVASKKIVSLALLVIFVTMGVVDFVRVYTHHRPFDFFSSFYTVLIFSDVLIVLISQRFLPDFHALLRNSGYAVSTLLMRLSLTAPKYYDAAIGAGAALFALLLTLAYNALYAKDSG